MWPLTSLRLSATARTVGLLLLALLLATYVWSPMIMAGPKTADLDGRYFLHQWEAGKAALRHGELPLWNPFDCRGVPMWDHPEAMTASPLLMLLAWVPGTTTIWIWTIVHCAAGFVSMWLLARREVGLARSSSFVAACMWAFSAGHTGQYSGGHFSLSDFWLAPLLVFLWRRAEVHLRHAVFLGLTVALLIYEGATYPLPFMVAVVALETLTRVWPVRRIPRIALAGAVTGVVAFGASAARLLPVADQLMSKKRQHMLPDVDVLAHAHTLKQMFLWREGHWYMRLPDQQYVWNEYQTYLGPVLLVLALMGLFVALTERRWIVGVAAVTTLLMLGHFARWAPWDLLNRNILPYRSMRVPSRFRLVLVMSLALFVALAVERVPKLLERFTKSRNELARGARVALLGAAFLGIGDGMGLAMDIMEWTHQGPPERSVVRSSRFHYGGPDLAEWLDQPRQNRAWLACRSYEWPAHENAPVWEGDVPQAKPKPGLEATLVVDKVRRTQNSFSFEVDAKAPGRVWINSAHAPGWRSNVGVVVEDGTLLALDLPAGQHHVVVRYWPRMMTPGLVISALTWTTLLGAWAWVSLRRRRARARRVAAYGAPTS